VVAVAAIAVTMTGATAAHASPSKSDLTKQIDQDSKQLEVLGEQYNAMQISLQKTQADLKKLQASLAPAKAALQVASAQMETVASTAYQQGRIGPMSALLDGNSTDLMAKISYLDQIQSANQKDIDTYNLTTQTFTQRQGELNTTRAKQSAQLKEMAARKKVLNSDIDKLKAKRTAVYGSPSQTAHSYNGPIPSISGAAGKAVSFAYKAIGKSYQINTAGPSEYDCSGLTMASWKAAGYSLPHNAAAQWGVVAHISRSDLKAGDLVFYNSLAHVGIYVGSNMIIDAPREGELVDKRSINRGMPIYGYGRVT
jgi:peptidoglycan DL-endopeptidase CwlO